MLAEQLARAFIDDEAIDGPEDPDIGDDEPPGYDLEDEGDDVDVGGCLDRLHEVSGVLFNNRQVGCHCNLRPKKARAGLGIIWIGLGQRKMILHIAAYANKSRGKGF